MYSIYTVPSTSFSFTTRVSSRSGVSITSSDRSSGGTVATSALLLLFDSSGWIDRGAFRISVGPKHQGIESCVNYEMCTDYSGNGIPTKHAHHCARGINSRTSCSPDEAITCPVQPRKLNSAWKTPKRRTIRLRSLTKGSEMPCRDSHRGARTASFLTKQVWVTQTIWVSSTIHKYLSPHRVMSH